MQPTRSRGLVPSDAEALIVGLIAELTAFLLRDPTGRDDVS